jgi:SulP family sulfate permease
MGHVTSASATRSGGRRTPWVFASLRGYERRWVGGDLIAGLTVWALLVSQALAYASIAQVPPVVGLYAAPGALLLYAALGSSRVLVVGPMAASAALSAATVADLVSPGAATSPRSRPGSPLSPELPR